MFELILCIAIFLDLERRLEARGHRDPRAQALIGPASFILGDGIGALLGWSVGLEGLGIYLLGLASGASAAALALAHIKARVPIDGVPLTGAPSPALSLTARLSGYAERRRTVSWIFLRLLGVIFLIAFVSLWVQVHGLVGEEGISPVSDYVGLVDKAYGEDALLHMPSVLYLWPTDGALSWCCALGVVLSSLLILDVAPMLALAGLFVLYLSLVHAGQIFLSFQWDILLLEVGFASMLLAAPRLCPRRPGAERPPYGALLALGFLTFRLMVASGLCKVVSGDATWADLTAMSYHYETQPLPNLLGALAHHLPGWIHALSALEMFAIELLAPLLFLLPGHYRRAGALMTIGLMGVIFATGNYGFFNLLTAALALLLLDDDMLPKVAWLEGEAATPVRHPGRVRVVVVGVVASLLMGLGGINLSMTVLRGESRPESFVAVRRAVAEVHISNSYGLFASMTTSRPELIIEGTTDGETWAVYDLPYKADAPEQPPPQSFFHMPRLDWQLWFAALSNVRRSPFVVFLMFRLLEGSEAVLGLFEEDPLEGARPIAVRAKVFDYRFAPLGEDGVWWTAKPLGLYAPVITQEMMRAYRAKDEARGE